MTEPNDLDAVRMNHAAQDALLEDLIHLIAEQHGQLVGLATDMASAAVAGKWSNALDVLREIQRERAEPLGHSEDLQAHGYEGDG